MKIKIFWFSIIALFILIFFWLFCLDIGTVIALAPQEVVHGNVVRVSLRTKYSVSAPVVALQNISAPLYKQPSGNYVTLLGTSCDWVPGKYVVTVNYRLLGRKMQRTLPLILTDGNYKNTRLSIPREKKQESTAEYEEMLLVRAALRQQSTENYLDGDFVSPLKPQSIVRVPSIYGDKRTYLDEQGRTIYSRSHQGLDYAVVEYTPVYAAQAGVVRLTAELRSFGRIAVLDHGQGVLSAYQHLNKFLVEEGQFVTKNSLIALSGNTGLSTGPHLHYALSVQGVFVQPEQNLFF